MGQYLDNISLPTLNSSLLTKARTYTLFLIEGVFLGGFFVVLLEGFVGLLFLLLFGGFGGFLFFWFCLFGFQYYFYKLKLLRYMF